MAKQDKKTEKSSVQSYVDGLSLFGKTGAEDPELTKVPELVVMVRDGKHADVHPLEVDNYKQGGWEIKNGD